MARHPHEEKLAKATDELAKAQAQTDVLLSPQGGNGCAAVKTDELKAASANILQAVQEAADARQITSSNPFELNMEGRAHERAGRSAEARRSYKASCVAGYDVGCLNLAMLLHHKTSSTDEDRREAASLYDTLCGRGNATACTYDGDLKLLLKDWAGARELYGKGCSLGDKRACEEETKLKSGKP